MGKQLANNEKIALKTKNARQMLQLQMDGARQHAYIEEMNKDVTEEEKAPYVKTGQLRIKNDSMNELKGALTDQRKAIFNNAKTKALVDYQNSPEIHQIDDEIIKTESNTVAFLRQKEQREILDKAQKEMEKAAIAYQVSSQCVERGLTSVEQVNYLLSEELRPRIDDFKAKESLFKQILELSKTHPELWDQFTDNNPRIMSALDNGGYRNVSTDELNEIISMFKSFMSNPPLDL